MKKFIFSLMMFATGALAQTVTVPVTMTVTLPVQTNAVTVTNVVVVVQTNAPTQIVPLQNDTVDLKLGTRLVRYMSGPANFTLAGFTNGSYATIYWINPGRFPITWPTNAFFLGNTPTNQARGAVLVEQVVGETWLSY